MIVDAILHQVLSLPALTLFRGMLVVAFLVGIAGSIIVPVFFQLLDNTKKAKARRKQQLPREAQATIDRLSRRVLEAHDRETALRKENHELRRLVAAETNFGRNHRADVQRTVGVRQ